MLIFVEVLLEDRKDSLGFRARNRFISVILVEEEWVRLGSEFFLVELETRLDSEFFFKSFDPVFEVFLPIEVLTGRLFERVP